MVKTKVLASHMAVVNTSDPMGFFQQLTGAGAAVPDTGAEVGERVTLEVRDERTQRSLRVVTRVVEVPVRRGHGSAIVQLPLSDRGADRLRRFAEAA